MDTKKLIALLERINADVTSLAYLVKEVENDREGVIGESKKRRLESLIHQLESRERLLERLQQEVES